MRSGARTPEELETLFEDAFVVRDRDGVAELFEDHAVLAAADRRREARGRAQIAQLAASIWEHDGTYVAQPRRVVQTGDTALVVGAHGTNVVRRGSDGAWRYAISLVSVEDETAWKEKK